MQLRDHPAIASKRDFFTVDPRLLKIQDGYNVRDLTTPQAVTALTDLKRSIIANGVRVPLEVRIDGEDLIIVAGHRRHAAVMAAIGEGHEIIAIPVIPEPKGMNEIERTLSLVVSNSGVPLTPIEIAEVIRRLIAFGWPNAQIAARLGWKSAQTVTHYISLLGADAEVQSLVRSGEVAVSTVAKVVKTDGAKAGETLRKALDLAKASGKTKVTAKSIAAAKGQFSPTPSDIQILIAALREIVREPERALEIVSQTFETLGLPIAADQRPA